MHSPAQTASMKQFDEKMKQTMKYAFAKGLFVAALATTFAACSTDDTTDQQPTAGQIKGRLQATMPDTRSQITVDEENGRFSGAWDASDAMTVYANSEKAGFTFNADTKVFEGELTNTTTDWTYQAIYPRVETEGAEHRIPFGAARTQNGSNFNGAYDPLVSEPVTHANSEPGKTPEGDAVTFGLRRLTSIIALTFTTDDAAVSTEKVQSVTLTAAGGEILAAQTFDISRDDQTGTLSTEGQSSSITMSYDAGSEPAAAEFKAYFNIQAGTYGALTATIVTEGHTATVALTDGATLNVGELAYKTTAVSAWDALAAAPTFEWVGHTPNADGTYDKEEVKKDMSVKVNLQAAAGIKGFVITIDSQTLAWVLGMAGAENIDGNIVTLDLINGTTDPAVNMVNCFILPDPDTKLEGYSELLALDLSELVPMILSLPNNVGDHIFTLTITDNQDRTLEKTLPFYVPNPQPAISYQVGAWNDMATFTLANIPATAQTVKVQYKATDESEWHDATVNAEHTTATVQPEFTSYTAADVDWTTLEKDDVKPYKRKIAGTGIIDGKTYEYKLIVDDFESEIATFNATASENPAIPSLDNSELSCYTQNNNTETTWWGSGNNSFASKLCTYSSAYKGAYLKAESGGLVAFVGLAPGNLFTGKFDRPSTDGTVYFGQAYKWSKRPSGVKIKYDAKTGNVNNGKHGWKIPEGDPDYARIFVAIVNWDKTRNVTSGMSTPKGCWNPETTTDPSGDSYGGGQIVAYASLWISQTELKGSFNEVTLPFNWYDENTNPANANYGLVISCATSAYGDYLNGYKSAEMYVGNFEWVY